MHISKDRKRGANDDILDSVGPEHDANGME